MGYSMVQRAIGVLDPSGMTAGAGTSTEGGGSGTSATNPDAVQWQQEPDMTGTGTRVVEPSSSGSSYNVSPSTSAKPTSNVGIALVGLLVVGTVGYLWLS